MGVASLVFLFSVLLVNLLASGVGTKSVWRHSDDYYPAFEAPTTPNHHWMYSFDTDPLLLSYLITDLIPLLTLGLIFALILIEWIGRRKSLALQFGLASISFLLIGICTSR